MALVIIDMQYGFNPEAKRAESGVLSLIKQAKQRREAIFVVAFPPNGRTLKSIWKALRGYPLVFKVRKYDIDGGFQLDTAIRQAWERGKIQRFSKIKFCGVWTSQCVADTFLSMCWLASISKGYWETALHPGTKMELVLAACADPSDALPSEYSSGHIRRLENAQQQYPLLKVA